MVGLGPRDVALRARDFFLRVVYGRLRLIDLGNEFWDLQHRQHLSLADMVPYIDVDMADVASHLGVQLDVLVGNELAGDGKRSGNGLSLRHSNRGVRYMFVACACFFRGRAAR